MTPRVSVIVPLYNKQAWIRRALDSIAAQTIRDIEVIVVDDGSTDGSGQIAQSYPDPRFRVICQANAGPGAARNRGLEVCAGEFVAFLDGDDEWLPDYLELALSSLTADPQAAAWSCSFFNGASDHSSEEMWRARGVGSGAFHATADTPPEQFVHRLAFMHCCATVARRSVVQRWGGFYAVDKCRYAEDSFLWIKVLLNETVRVEPAAHIRIHHDAGSLSQNLASARPLEPFLEKPELIEPCCPPALKGLLRDVLSIRAFKSACMLGYWGDWARAAALRRRFRSPGDRRLPYYWYSALFSTPAGAATAALWRMISRRADPPLR